MAELLEMDVVSIPTYDRYQAAGTALRMAGRITGRERAVAVGGVRSDKLSRMTEYARPTIAEIVLVDDTEAAALESALDDSVAVVMLELPGATELTGCDLSSANGFLELWLAIEFRLSSRDDGVGL